MAHPSALDSSSDDEYVEAALAAVVAAPVLARARFARPRARVWLLPALALVLAAPAAALAFARAEALAPSLQAALGRLPSWMPLVALAAAALLLSSFLVVIARAGRVRLTTEVIEGRRRIGGKFRVPLARIARFSLRDGTLLLATRDATELCKLPRLDPGAFAGLVWIVARYHGLPNSVVRALADEPLDGLFEDVLLDGVEREFVPNGVATLCDRGFAVSIGDTHVYLPASSTLEIPDAPSPWRQLLAPNIRKQLVAEPGIPRPDRLPLKRLAKAVLRSNLYASHKIALLTTIAANHGGTVAESVTFPSTALRGSTAGCEVRIRRVAELDSGPASL